MYTVLVVDDEENIRKALIHYVDWESLGFHIIADVSNGIEALEYVENNDIDLLVTDIKMPIMGGIELARVSREIRPSMQIVFLSGHDQFGFALQAIKYNIMSYILKPITEEEIIREFSSIKRKLDEKFSEILDIDAHYDTLKELQNIKRELFVSKLIKGGFTQSQLLQAGKKIDSKVPILPENARLYVVCVVKNDTVEENAENELKGKRIFNVSKIISEKYLDCECAIFADTTVILAYGSKETLDKYIPILSKDIVMSSKRVINTKIYFSQSNYYDNIMNSGVAFQEALNALNLADKSDTQIIHIKDVYANEQAMPSAKYFDDFEQSMLSGDVAGVEHVLYSIFWGLHMHSKTFHAVILRILSVIFKVCGTLEGTLRDNVTQVFSIKLDTDLAKDEVIQLSLHITAQIANSRQKSVDNLANCALEIVQNEYFDPEISLRSVAKRIFCSPNYLSSIIRKATGESFVDALTRIRLEKANTMLRQTNMKIREISEQCGYANQQYFSYSFKKYFNKSPNAVRKELSSNEGNVDENLAK